jgi:hypothetical protein
MCADASFQIVLAHWIMPFLVGLSHCVELFRWKAGCMSAGTPAGEYAVGNRDAAGKVSIAAYSHGIPTHGIETIYR